MYMKLRTPLSLLVQAVLFGEGTMDGSLYNRLLILHPLFRKYGYSIPFAAC